MNKLFIGRAEYLAASNWDELTQTQALKAAFVLFAGYEAGKQRALLLSYLIPKKVYTRLSYSQLAAVLPLTNWFGGGIYPSKNIFPEIMGLYGPSENFGDIQFIEFIKGEELFKKLRGDFSPGILAELAAVFYRPPGRKGRGDFSDLGKKERIERLLYFEKRQKKGSFLNWFFLAYCGLRERIIKSFPNIFLVEDIDKSGNKTTLAELMLTIADDPLRIEKTGLMNVFTLFYSLTLKEKREGKK